MFSHTLFILCYSLGWKIVADVIWFDGTATVGVAQCEAQFLWNLFSMMQMIRVGLTVGSGDSKCECSEGTGILSDSPGAHGIMLLKCV